MTQGLHICRTGRAIDDEVFNATSARHERDKGTATLIIAALRLPSKSA
jgi:hypothetical protein